MRAAQIDTYGNASVMHTVNDAPRPTAKNNEVIVAVKAAGVNAADWKIRNGDVRAMRELQFPAILGGDLAGIVSELGQGVTGLNVGDEVFGQADFLGSHGTFAEFTPIQATTLAPKPRNASFIEAAALPTTAVSAYQVIVDRIKLQPGQKILIHGGAGGIGSFAIQIAKHLGAFVATTATGDGLKLVKKLGADQIIDYKNEDFTKIVEDFDAVHDTVGGDTFVRSFEILRPGGILVSMLSHPELENLAEQHNVTAMVQVTNVTTEYLRKVAELVETGAIQPIVDKTFPLEDASEAVAYVEAGRQSGKVVITI